MKAETEQALIERGRLPQNAAAAPSERLEELK